MLNFNISTKEVIGLVVAAAAVLYIEAMSLSMAVSPATAGLAVLTYSVILAPIYLSAKKIRKKASAAYKAYEDLLSGLEYKKELSNCYELASVIDQLLNQSGLAKSSPEETLIQAILAQMDENEQLAFSNGWKARNKVHPTSTSKSVNSKLALAKS